MILVDTSVWIDFFSPRETACGQKLTKFIENGIPVCINGIVQMEIEMGIKSDAQLKKIKEYLIPFQYCPDITGSELALAADIYRRCRKRGITIRKSVDCMIAAQCMQRNMQILHNDQDFGLISKVFKSLLVV